MQRCIRVKPGFSFSSSWRVVACSALARAGRSAISMLVLSSPHSVGRFQLFSSSLPPASRQSLVCRAVLFTCDRRVCSQPANHRCPCFLRVLCETKCLPSLRCELRSDNVILELCDISGFVSTVRQRLWQRFDATRVLSKLPFRAIGKKVKPSAIRMSGGAVASAVMTTTTRDDRQEVAAVTRESSMRASTSTSSNSSNGTMEEAVIDATRHASSLQTAGVNADAVPRAPSPSSSVKRSPNDFIFLRTIGEGSFSTVYHGKEVATRNEYAIKVCNKMQIKRENKIELIHRERDVMARLSTGNSHPFFVKLYCTFQDSERLYFAMSLAKNGELLTYLRRLGSFDDEVAQFYAAEIVLALQHLHSLGIVHRDLKPENILLGADNHILISDFGSSKILGQQDDGVLPTRRITAIRRSSDDDATTTSAEDEIPAITSPPRPTRSSFVGTAQYVSPEVLNGKPVQQACDYWALGAIVYQMIAGLPPFRGVNEYLIFQKIIKIDFSFPEGFPDDARDLVSQFLVLNAGERLGSVERGGAESVMSHRYFAGIDWKSLPQRDPPALKPYLPASGDEPAFHSEYHYPNDVEPGLDDAAMTRLMGLQLGLFSAVPTVPVEIAMENKTMEERRRKLDAQRKENKFHRFVNDNIILKSGFVDKKKGLFARRRMFLLTEGPHLYYVDPANMELKGEIPWCRELRTEAKNFRTFFVHTPNRTYYLFDPARQAVQWCQAIESVRERYFSHT